MANNGLDDERRMTIGPWKRAAGLLGANVESYPKHGVSSKVLLLSKWLGCLAPSSPEPPDYSGEFPFCSPIEVLNELQWVPIVQFIFHRSTKSSRSWKYFNFLRISNNGAMEFAEISLAFCVEYELLTLSRVRTKNHLDCVLRPAAYMMWTAGCDCGLRGLGGLVVFPKSLLLICGASLII